MNLEALSIRLSGATNYNKLFDFRMLISVKDEKLINLDWNAINGRRLVPGNCDTRSSVNDLNMYYDNKRK